MAYLDIFFTPEYQELFKDTAFGGEPCCFDQAGIEYRFYKRPIEGTNYFDIVSPYGYSGLISIGEADITYWGYDVTFNTMFHQYCLENNVIAEFARLHPFLANHEYLGGDVSQNGEVVYIDLTQPFKFDKGCKSSIKKAQRSGISVGYEAFPSIFYCLYTETMERNKADKDYFFDVHFFQQLLELPSACQFNAWYNGKIVASIILLIYGDYAHYFLAGSDEKYLNLCPSNLLLSEGISWAKEQGCKIFNLGGGKDESHSSFKRSFSHTTKPFYTYRKIHNQEIYNELCRTKGINPKNESWFPAYRR